MGANRKNYIIIELIIDSFVILFEICTYISLFTYLIVDRFNLYPNFIVFGLISIAHLFRFGFPHIPLKNNYLLFLLFFILAIDVVQYAILGTLKGSAVVDLLNAIIFSSYLFNCYYYYLKISLNKTKSLNIVLSSYLTYSFYNVATITLLFILFLVGFVSLNYNNVDGTTFSLLGNNMIFGHSYTFPYCLGFIRHEGFYRFFNLPGFCGLFHEQQSLCLFILPSFFILSDYLIKAWEKTVIVILFVLVIVLARSTTAVIAFSIVIVVYLFDLSLIKKSQLPFFAFFILSLFALLLFYNPIQSFYQHVAVERFISDDSSKDVSLSFIDYMMSASELLGSGNLLSGGGVNVGKKIQIGYLTLLLDISLYIYSFKKIIEHLISPSSKNRGVVYGVTYYLLHTFKMPMYVMHTPLLVFNLFLLTIVSKNGQHE